MALFVEFKVVGSWSFPIRARRDYGVHSSFEDGHNQRVRVVSLVGNEVTTVGLFEERRRFDDVVGITWCKTDSERISSTIHESVDFGGKPPSGPTNSLVKSPFFPRFACWWTRTQLESTMFDVVSAFADNSFSTVANTPRAFQRENRVCTVCQGP